MELGSIIGLISGIFFIAISILINAKFDVTLFSAMLNAPSVLIVVGGVFASVLIAYPLSRLMASLKSVKKVFKPSNIDPSKAIKDIISLANLARKEGLLALEDAVQEVDDDFLKKGIMLIVDGTDPELVRGILETELSYQELRHSDSRSIWEFIASMGPAWGMIGTLIGLVLMLQDLSDPETIGPNMAVALLTTLYGTILANLVASPIANKMRVFSREELLMKEVLIEGMLSIQAGENPRIIEEKLKAFLSPDMRNELQSKDGSDVNG